MIGRRRRPTSHAHLADDLDEGAADAAPARSRLRGRGPRRMTWTELAIFALVAAMATLAVAGLRPALTGWAFITSGAVGAVGATLVTVIARVRRWLLGESVALSALAFIALGGVAVAGVPTPDAYQDFVGGLTRGWAEFLSSPAPTDLTPELRALPFTIAWLAAAAGGEIARHVRRPGLPAIGPILGLGLTLLFGVLEQRVALVQGAGLLAGTLLLISLGQRAMPRTVAQADEEGLDGRTKAGHRTRLALGGLVLLGAVAAAPWLGPRLPLADDHDRFDLRRYQVPPFDPLALPSPLVQVKANLKENRREDVVFTISGPTVSLLPVAVLTDYDGVVWTVGDPERNRVQAEFAPVDAQLPVLDRVLPEDAPVYTHTFELRDQNGFFLPTAGSPTRLEVEGVDVDARMNLTTGTIALPGGAVDGLVYQVTSVVPPAVSDDALAESTITPVVRTEELELLPPVVRDLAADIVQGQPRGWGQMAAIRDAFVGDTANESEGGGFYDVSAETPPGHSYGRIASMLDDPERIVGYEEQYAAAAAVLGRVADLPTRVVVGYRIPETSWENGTAAVTANDISAWIEIDAGERGWVPVEVTPDRNREPDPETQATQDVPIAIPNPPPPPPPPPDVQPPRQAEDELEAEEEFEPIGHSWEVGDSNVGLLVAVGAGGGPVALFLLFAATVIAWKTLRRRRRRRRRSPAARVAGAWAEAVDRAVESGAPIFVRTTPREAVSTYAAERPDLGAVVPDLDALARELDRAVFAPSAPGDEHVERAWTASDRVAGGLRERRSLPGRVKMRIDPRPLRRDTTKTGVRS